jgi:hypothetical protein
MRIVPREAPLHRHPSTIREDSQTIAYSADEQKEASDMQRVIVSKKCQSPDSDSGE